MVIAKLIELLMLCHIFLPRRPKARKKSLSILGTFCSSLTLLYQVLISVAHVFSPLSQLWMHFEYSGIKITQELATHVLSPLKFCRCASDEDVPVRN